MWGSERWWVPGRLWCSFAGNTHELHHVQKAGSDGCVIIKTCSCYHLVILFIKIRSCASTLEAIYYSFITSAVDRDAVFSLYLSLACTVEGKHTIDRDCAVEGENKCVMRTGTKDIKLEYCECKNNKCNGAVRHYSVWTVLAFSLITVLTYFARS